MAHSRIAVEKKTKTKTKKKKQVAFEKHAYYASGVEDSKQESMS